MSLKNRFLSILTVALGVVAFSTFALAQDTTTTPEKTEKRVRGERGAHRGPMDRKAFGDRDGKRGMEMFGFRGIELTEAQKAQIKTIRESNKPSETTLTELKAIREARKAGTAITPEQKERLKALHEQSAAKAKSVHEQILAVLTADQKTKLDARKAEMLQRMEERKLNRKQRPAAPRTDKPKTN
jgi:periplasmic protein CpxP/Spy